MSLSFTSRGIDRVMTEHVKLLSSKNIPKEGKVMARVLQGRALIFGAALQDAPALTLTRFQFESLTPDAHSTTQQRGSPGLLTKLNSWVPFPHAALHATMLSGALLIE